jgi:hypothetical protein
MRTVDKYGERGTLSVVANRQGAVFTVRATNLNTQKIHVQPTPLFVCFVWISAQTAIISLYSTNWLVFITETESVYCAVRAVFLNVILYITL